MATIKKAQSGAKTTKKPESTVMKPLAKKDRYSSLGGEIGEPPFGGKKPKPGTKIFNGVTGKYDVTKKNGGAVKKAKSGGSFPDLNKDGKVTKADILKGRGVIAKSGAKMKKAQSGIMAKASKAISGAADKAGKWIKAHQTGGAESERQRSITAKAGASMKKCKYGCN
jgi:hypothetical protein